MYTLTADDIHLIMKYDFNWDKTELKYIKNNIKQILINNNSECFYCKSPLDEGSSPGDIEHIVPKDPHKIFSFLPINLTLTCRRCNTAKGRKNVLQGYTNQIFSIPEDYPSTSGDFLIIHAYYDLYESYIKLEDSIFFKGIDSGGKGESTIRICNLTRLDLALSKVKMNYLQRSIEENLVKKMVSSNNNSQENEMLLHLFESKLKLNVPDEKINIAIEKVNKNYNVVDIVDELFKIEELHNITTHQITKLREWLDYTDTIGTYVNLINYLHTLKTLVPLISPHLENMIFQNSSGYLLLNPQGLIKLKDLLNTVVFKGLQAKSKSKLLSMIAELEIINFNKIPNGIFIESETESILDCLNGIKEIFQNQVIKSVLNGINSQTFDELRDSILLLYNNVDKNPKFGTLSKIEWYYHEIFTLEKENIWDIHKNLKGLMKLMNSSHLNSQ
ncbi:HNH endonuclease [Paenibacillus sp. FSL R7-0333]|uniref:HNH endonuclease n=1 Tax=Paenibacillus sp. FSL R7-0333 TaxID=1926587 RepID=UPI00096C42B5|nr:hypothetical protein BK146_03210 [Paenibacillus sp. FSL R7-0333]